MTTELHVGIVRVLASSTRFGESFQVPEGSPLIVRLGEVELQLHVGTPPDWLCLAIGRRRALANSLLRLLFNSHPMDFQACWNAQSDPIVDRSRYETSVTVCLKTTLLAELSSSHDALWWRRLPTDSLLPWIASTKLRFEPILDLLERIIPDFLPNAVSDRVLNTRVVFALDPSFEEAFSYPDETSATGNASVASPESRASDALRDLNFSATLANCLGVTPTPIDPGRQRRLEEAAKTGRLRDRAGFLGKAELLADLQVEQVRYSELPLSVAFIDMNGLKQINDEQNHDAGDRAIEQFQSVVSKYAQNGLVYRDGGDEFVLFLRLSRSRTVEHLIELLRELATSTDLSASVGLAFAAGVAESPANLRKRADEAMYRAKVASKEPGALQAGRRPCALCAEDGPVELVHRTTCDSGKQGST